MLAFLRTRCTLVMRATVALWLLGGAAFISIVQWGERDPDWLNFALLAIVVLAVPASLVTTLLGTRVMYPSFDRPAEPEIVDGAAAPPGEAGRHARPGWSNPGERDH
jgi:hypothetical protein